MPGPAGEITDYAVGNLIPKRAACATCLQDVVASIVEASRLRESLIPWGGGTKIDVGNIPFAYDVALCLDGLNRVVDYDTENLTLTVEAGVRLADVLAMVADHGQYLPLSPPSKPKATVGGIVSASDYGPEAGRYGYVRDFVLGLEVVLPSGEIARFGGKVVKNVAGLNVPRIFVGSYGAFGVITKVTFRLIPRPEKTMVLGFWLDGITAVPKALTEIATSRVDPAAIEIFSPSLPELESGKRPRMGDPVLVAARLEGFEEEISWQRQAVERCFEAGIPAEAAHFEPYTAADTNLERVVVKMRTHFYSDVTRGNAALLRVVTPSSQLNSVVTASRGLARMFGLTMSVMCYGLDGTTFLRLSGGHGQDFGGVDAGDFAKRIATFIRELRAKISEPVVAVHIPLAGKRGVDVWGDFSGSRLMRRLKAVIDPHGILAPGRI